MNTNFDPKTQNDDSNVIWDASLRQPIIQSASYFDTQSDLDDEEKRVGAELFEALRMYNVNGMEQPPEQARMQGKNPSYIMYSHDPLMYRNYITWYNDWIGLVCGMSNAEILATTGVNGLDAVEPQKRRRYEAIMLITIKVAHEYNDEWCLRLMSTVPAWTLTKEQFCVLGLPQSAVWSEEQSLLLEFTSAVIHRNISDELYTRAENFWGRKQLIRYSSFIVHYIGLVLMGPIVHSDASRRGAL